MYWLTYAAAGKHLRAFTLGPVVEIAFVLDMQLKQLTKSRDGQYSFRVLFRLEPNAFQL